MGSDKKEFQRIFETIDFDSIKDHPNILIAAKFWEQDRYCAARICYKFMRYIDDMIDDYKAANNTIAPSERDRFIENVSKWMNMIIVSRECNPEQKELIETIEKYRIPVWPLEAFARSMIYDINNDGFPTLSAFLDYSQGASVAPASIFVHLNGLIKRNGNYEAPAFDVREAATPCAIFSYLVHIVRDFQKDQLNNLNYFADDIAVKYSLSRHDLKEIAYGHPFGYNFREMIGVYYSLADEYRLATYDIIKKISPLLEPRYQLSLEIIFDLYLMVFERIDIKNGNFSTIELNPSPEETRQRVFQTIERFCK
jgi:phytoene/squalene synthetase